MAEDVYIKANSGVPIYQGASISSATLPSGAYHGNAQQETTIDGVYTKLNTRFDDVSYY
jgi:hypothetical protein